VCKASLLKGGERLLPFSLHYNHHSTIASTQLFQFPPDIGCLASNYLAITIPL
jgi:hypothetical protein